MARSQTIDNDPRWNHTALGIYIQSLGMKQYGSTDLPKISKSLNFWNRKRKYFILIQPKIDHILTFETLNGLVTFRTLIGILVSYYR